MTKDKLQQELLEKVREGIKPSDLKKPSQKQPKKPISPPPIAQSKDYESDEGYSSDDMTKEKNISLQSQPNSKTNPKSEISKNQPTSPTTENKRLEKNISDLQTQIKALHRQLQVY